MWHTIRITCHFHLLRELAGPRGFPLGVTYQFAIVSWSALVVNGRHLVLHFSVREPIQVLPWAVSLALQGEDVRIVRCCRLRVILVTVGHLLNLDGCTCSAGPQTALDLASVGQALVTVHVRHHLAQVDGLLAEDDALLSFILLR